MKGKRMKSPKEETEALLDELLPLAKKMLSAHGEFYPYGGFISRNGDIVHVSAKGQSDHPSSRELIDILRTKFRKDAAIKYYRATGIVYDVRVCPPGASKKTDAIQVCLDHKENYSAEVFYPYKILLNGVLKLGDVFAQQGENLTFKED